MPQSERKCAEISVDEYISSKTEINDAARRVWCMCPAVNILSGVPISWMPIRIYVPHLTRTILKQGRFATVTD